MELSKRLPNYHEALRLALLIGFFILCGSAMFGVPSGLTDAVSPVLRPASIALVGFMIGCYGTIIGIGGGPLIMPALIMFYGWRSEFLVATSLFVVFLNTLSGTIGYARQKRIDYTGGLKFSLAAIPGAMVMGYAHHLFTVRIFDVIFGIFLIFLAIYSLLGANKIKASTARVCPAEPVPGARHVHFVDSFGQEFEYYSNDSLGMGLNGLLGFFVGFLGIGGGVFQVPILVFMLSYPVHVGTATSHFITTTVTFFALIPHFYLGNIRFVEAVWMGVGVVLGAQVGAMLAPKINDRVIVYLFVAVIILLSLKMLA